MTVVGAGSERVGPVGDAQWAAFLRFLSPRAIPGVEEVVEGAYRRTIRSGGAAGVLSVAAARQGNAVELTVQGLDGAALRAAKPAVHRMLDLDADSAAIDRALGADPLLAPLVAARPGLRAPGAYDGWELAVRAIVGQQVSVGAATTLAGRVVRAVGTPLERPVGSLTHAFPLPHELSSAPLPGIGMPGRRVETLRALARAIDAGVVTLDGSVNAETTQTALIALPGIGPWTAGYIAMRALGDPDAFPIGDIGLRRAAVRLGLPGEPRALGQAAERWRPYRSYAAYHLWASLAATSGG
jgi:AraC family transcriptional regulator of adaptative response / DNA-3-methyladenine glycosylase II